MEWRAHTHRQPEHVGFKAGVEDPESLWGCMSTRAPLPSALDINSRLRCGRRMAQLCCTPDHTPEAHALAQQFVAQLEMAAKDCVSDLHQVIKEHKKAAKAMYNWRWMEICPHFQTFLASHYVPPQDRWKSWSNISNLPDVNFNQVGNMTIPMLEADYLYKLSHANWLH